MPKRPGAKFYVKKLREPDYTVNCMLAIADLGLQRMPAFAGKCNDAINQRLPALMRILTS